ncbi:TPA: choline dehydrogenase 3 [Trebouxia sp. C0005]
MILCSKYISGYHIDCLKPALPGVPKGDWLCDKCKATVTAVKTASDNRMDEPQLPLPEQAPQLLDITEDAVTSHYLKIKQCPTEASDTEKAHIRNKSAKVQTMRHTFNEPTVMTPILVHSAFHKVGIDIVGPAQRPANGHRYIHTSIDYMTKWLEAKGLCNDLSCQ